MANEPRIDAPQSMHWQDIGVWRRAQREYRVAWRIALPETERIARGRRITASLLTLLPSPRDIAIGFCWPFQAEFDPRFAVRQWREQGAIVALPEVLGKGLPLRFRQWWPGAPMIRGIYDIPVPDATPEVVPDIMIVPMNAFDACGYRLGYGGGYFDLTLARPERRAVAIGVAYEGCRVPTIYPQPHDIAMDLVVTEAGIHAAGGEPLQLLDASAALARLQALLRARHGARGNQ
jgi:5,10-methenyltetrahydrofolate synthetase